MRVSSELCWRERERDEPIGSIVVGETCVLEVTGDVRQWVDTRFLFGLKNHLAITAKRREEFA